jgi:propionyl-CoA carboxylase beta chain
VTEEGGGRGPRGPSPATASEWKLDQHRERRHRLLRREAGARDRIEALLDLGSFVELDLFATAGTAGADEDRPPPGSGVVAGHGTIDGRDVAVYAFDPTVQGGPLGRVTAEKIVKVQELALRSRIPIIGLNESGGARVQDGITGLAGCADVLHRAVRSSGVIPQLSVICGPCGGEAIHAPALTDFIFVVAGAGGDATFDPMSGGAHFLPEDEARCWQGVRSLLSHLPAHSGEAPPFRPTADPADRADAELQTLVPDDPSLPYDMREVVTRLLDDRQLLEVQPFFAPNVLVGLGRLGGHAVGVVANQPQVLAGAIDAGASTKAAGFIRFCDAFNLPLVSLVDAPDHQPGAAQGHGATVRHGARLLYAYAEATVPKLAVVTRRDHGWAYCAMSPKQMGADLNLAWPGAEIGVTGPEGAAASLYAAAELGYVDDVIEPRQTRLALLRGLELCLRKTVERPARKHGNIPL